MRSMEGMSEAVAHVQRCTEMTDGRTTSLQLTGSLLQRLLGPLHPHSSSDSHLCHIVTAVHPLSSLPSHVIRSRSSCGDGDGWLSAAAAGPQQSTRPVWRRSFSLQRRWRGE